MDELTREILKQVDIDPEFLDGALIPRDMLLNDSLYVQVREKLPELRKKFSSSYMTSLHKGAKEQQKWPLLNLIRQVLHTYQYQMKPIRKSDGYTPQGVKKYKRFFLISKVSLTSEPEKGDEEISKTIEISNNL